MLHKSCTPELYPNPCPFLFVLFSCYWVVWAPDVFWQLTSHQADVLQIFSLIP
jgi:hypothetical protein